MLFQDIKNIEFGPTINATKRDVQMNVHTYSLRKGKRRYRCTRSAVQDIPFRNRAQRIQSPKFHCHLMLKA